MFEPSLRRAHAENGLCTDNFHGVPVSWTQHYPVCVTGVAAVRPRYIIADEPGMTPRTAPRPHNPLEGPFGSSYRYNKNVLLDGTRA